MLAGLVLLAALVAASALAAAALRLASGVGFLLAAYLAATVQLVGLSIVLSPFDAVGRTGYAVGQGLVACGATVAWQLRGRPGIPLRLPRVDFRTHPVLAVLLAAVGAALAYELFLVIVAAPNTWDSLTYHLTRVAQWYQHESVGWIDDAPTGRQNSYPRNAELEILASVVYFGSDRLAELPQYIAQLAIGLGVYGVGRRLGFAVEESLFAALILLTLSEVALQSTTTQNDLVVSALLVSTVFFLLGRSGVEVGLAGTALGLALGTKLTAVFALPVVLALALVVLGLRRGGVFVGWTALAFALLSSPLYLRSLAETGNLLGSGEDIGEYRSALTPEGVVATTIRIGYRMLDLSGWRDTDTPKVLFAAVALALACGLVRWRRRRDGLGAVELVVACLVLIAPFTISTLAENVQRVVNTLGLPLNPHSATVLKLTWGVNTDANEDLSYFGPLGALLVAPAAAVVAFRELRRRRMSPRLVLALGLPAFVLVLAVGYSFNPWIGRFMVVPVTFSAALAAVAYRRRILVAAVAAIGVATLLLTHAHNALKPVWNTDAEIWKLDAREAEELASGWRIPAAFARLDERVPATQCLGAYVGRDDPSYPLYGLELERRVFYVSGPEAAERRRLLLVVIGPGVSPRRFRDRPGWVTERLAGRWWLAERPTPPAGCPSG